MGPGAQDRKDKENQRTWTILQLGKEREYPSRSIFVWLTRTVNHICHDRRYFCKSVVSQRHLQSGQFLPCVTIRSDEEQTPKVFQNFDSAVVPGSVT